MKKLSNLFDEYNFAKIKNGKHQELGHQGGLIIDRNKTVMMAKRKRQNNNKNINSQPRSIEGNQLDFRPIIERVENFLKINLLLIHKSCDDYVFGHKTKSRIFWVSMTRVALFLSLIRFFDNSSNTETVG